MDTFSSIDPGNCEACQALASEEANAPDAEPHHRIRNENQLVKALEDTQDHIADGITSFAGSMRFVYLHSVWFAIWILLNIGILGAGLKFDKFPFGLLTMIVSLEAIFLSTFVMVSQNRQATRADLRAQVDFETNVRSEIWAIHIADKLGVDSSHVEHVVAEAIKASRSAQ
jgi:uncharacterized membrane protein